MTDVVFGQYNESAPPKIRFYTIRKQGNWQDLGTIERLYEHIYGNNLHDQQNNILFPGAWISPNAKVTNTIVYPGAQISAGAIIDYSIVSENARVESNTKASIVAGSGISIYGNNSDETG